MVVSGLSSTLSLTNRTSSRSSDISSRIGETRRHGTHHGAQKSTMTGVSDLRTSLSNVASVTSATAIPSKPPSLERSTPNADILARPMDPSLGAGALRPALLEAAREEVYLHVLGELLGPAGLEEAGA